MVARSTPGYGGRLARPELRRGDRHGTGAAPGRLRPGRPDEPHCPHALDRADAVERAADRPPAIARRLHEAGALEPALAATGRAIAAIAAALELEAEQLEPVPQPRQRDHLALARQEGPQQP